MRTRVLVAGALLVGLLPTSLAACASPEPNLTPSHSDSRRPSSAVYASKQEADISMRDAFAKYESALNTVAQSSGTTIGELRPYVTQDQYDSEIRGLERLKKLGAKVSGSASVANFTLQRVDLQTGNGTAYVCVDVSKTRILSKSGKDVTPANRRNFAPLLATFVRGPLVSGVRTWSASDIC